MPDLQSEMKRFQEARFGADVKDAFISCVQKIHDENQSVVALEESMRASAQEVSTAKQELTEQVEEVRQETQETVDAAKAELNEHLDATEEAILSATKEASDSMQASAAEAQRQAQMAVQTADDAKEISRGAEKNASEALATAINASSEASNASGDAELAIAAAQKMENNYANLQMITSAKVDGAFVENGYLYLTSDNVVVAGPLGPFSGTGGGSGGSSGGNNAVLSVSNASGWLSKSVAFGGACEISVLWSSLEDELPTGNGVMKIVVNGATKAMLDIPQGTYTTDISKYLSAGTNAVKVTVSDVYENSRTINFSVHAIELSITSTFDPSTAFTGLVSFTYVPVGSVMKNVHIILDGKEIATVKTSSSGRQMTYSIPAQSHGAHSLLVYFDAEVNGQVVESNRLYYELICVETLNSTPIIVSNFNQEFVGQYTSLAIPFAVYDPQSLTAEVNLSVNGNVVSRLTVDRTQQLWTYRADDVGALTLTIACGSAKRTLTMTVTASEVSVEAEKDALSLYLSSYGRSNQEENPGAWSFGDIAATFSGFNFTSDGWQLDEDKISVLRVSGDARLTIPVQPFAKDFRTTGKTIELEFATRDVRDYDAPVLTCMSGGRGILVTPQKATLASEQTQIFTQYKENEHLRLAFAVEKRAENRLIYCYINGILSGVVQYPADDDFSQTVPVDISVGSNDAVIDLYCIRVYENDLTRHQVLTNWIADTQVVETMLERYSRNRVFDDYSQIVIAQLPNDLPYLVLEGVELPQAKGDKKTMSGSYTDPTSTARCFTFKDAVVDVQGTSSQYYARKNYKIIFSGGFTDAMGVTKEAYSMRPGAIATDTYTFKADVASSEGANNVELVRLYNDTCPYQTKPQQENPAIRQGIDGFPIVVFWYDGEKTTFLGKYNFNNDKSTPEVYGFASGDESWEILNNTSQRVLWKSDDYSGEDWQNDFEARYPDKFKDSTELSKVASWLKSTDQETATGDALPVDRFYAGVRYTNDTKEYRLAKFKAEFDSHFEKDAVLFYYLFTELFLMVDSRAKNMFPTFMGGSKWFSLPYDFDTALGINNEGTLAFSYNLEDIDKTENGADVYNGQQSVLWVNVRQAFFEELKTMYQKLRSTGAWSYSDTERRFEEHQSKWPEAIFNEDAYYKYLAPLEETGTAVYLAMLQGSKAEQRAWWLYNRYRYLDSKYNAGDALTDVITLRGYAKADITVMPYADIYASIKYGSYLVQQRANRNHAYTLACPLDNVNDTEIYVYSASQLRSVGDISGLEVGFADFSMATRLQELKIGDSQVAYSNRNLTELHLGNNTLLRTLDVRNCPNLTQAVDVSGCTGIEHLYFEGTAITGLNLPNGGIIKTLHLPASITNLTIRNQKAITDFSIPSYENISTLRLENVNEVIPCREILTQIPATTRMRMIGFSWSVETEAELLGLYTLLDTMRGLDENGDNLDKAQMQGIITIPSINGTTLRQCRERYPNITIEYAELTAIVTFYDYSGETQLETKTVLNGKDTSFGGFTPEKPSTPQYKYKFSGWSLKAGGAADANALKVVTENRNVYAAFTSSIRSHTVRFYNGDILLETQAVEYGKIAVYSGETPVHIHDSSLPFIGWYPAVTYIQESVDTYAQYQAQYELAEIAEDWDGIIASVDDGTYVDKYKVGHYKALDFGIQGIVRMQVAAVNRDDLVAGGKAPLTFIAMDCLNSTHTMTKKTLTDDPDNTGKYLIGTGSVGGWDASDLKRYLNEEVYPLIPENVRSRIKHIAKSQKYYDTSLVEGTQTTDELIWIPAYEEMKGVSAYYYSLFRDNAKNLIRDSSAYDDYWWTRSATYYGKQYVIIRDTGDSVPSYWGPSSVGDYGVVPCFCIGKA